MHKIYIELAGLSPASVDRLIRLLYQYLAEEPDGIFLKVSDKGPQTIELPVGGGRSLLVPVSHIRHVTSDRHRTIFCLEQETLSIRMNFSAAAGLLSGSDFLDCSRGILLNMNHIRDMQGDCFIMDDGARFPIRRNGRREIQHRYEQFRLQQSRVLRTSFPSGKPPD